MRRGTIAVVDPSGGLVLLVDALSRAGFTIASSSVVPDAVLTSDWASSRTRTEPVVAVTSADEQASAIAEGATDAWDPSVHPRVAAARLDLIISRDAAARAGEDATARERALLRGSLEGLWLWDHLSDELTLSPSARQHLGLDGVDGKTFLGNWLERIHQDDRQMVRSAFESQRTGESPLLAVEHRIRSATAQWRWVRVQGAPGADSSRPVCSGGSLVDITALRGTDPVTGLPNGERFREALALAIERARRRAGTVFGVARISLNGWDALSASLGPLRAEPYLRQAGAALAATVRAVDTVSRFGNGEFAVVLEHVDTPRNALVVARRLKSALSFTVEGDDGPTLISASIGLATTGIDCSEADELLAEAGSALSRAQEHGSGIEIYDHVAHCRAIERLEIEADLGDAVSHENLHVHYQPIIHFESGVVAGFEALVRWTSPEHGPVPPGRFIPIAEETGLIRPLGLFVLRRSLEQLAAWQKLGGTRAIPLTMSVNVSPRQLEDGGFVSAVQAALDTSGVPPASLILEITESVLIDDRIQAVSRLASLRSLGVGIAIDDFGTGHSTLGYLHQLPATKLKIDQSFVRPIEPGSGRPDFVRSIVLLAHEIGLDVVAEGVETRADRDRLAALGCDHGQGYFWTEPLAPDHAERFLREG